MKTTSMRTRWTGLALLGLGVALSVPMGSWAQGGAQAQPDPNNAGLGVNPPNRARRQRGQRGQRAQGGAMGPKALAKLQERELANAEAVAGKPLSEEQKQKVRESLAKREKATREARETYVAEMAASLGMEPDEVRLKLREATLANLAQRAADLAAGPGARAGRRNRAARGATPAQ